MEIVDIIMKLYKDVRVLEEQRPVDITTMNSMMADIGGWVSNNYTLRSVTQRVEGGWTLLTVLSGICLWNLCFLLPQVKLSWIRGFSS